MRIVMGQDFCGAAAGARETAIEFARLVEKLGLDIEQEAAV